MSEELACKHLLAAVSTIENSNSTSLLLKSYLLAQCSKISTYTLKLPYKIFGPNVRCSNCFISWDDMKTAPKVHVSKKKLTSSAKKRYKLIKRNKNGAKNQSAIDNASRILNSDIYIIKCGVCNKPTELLCEKRKLGEKNLSESVKITNTPVIVNKNTSTDVLLTPIRSSTPSNVFKKKTLKEINISKLFYQSSEKKAIETPQPSHPVNTPNNNIKKKRHRDKFAGLCKMACTSTTNTPKKNNPLNMFLKSI